MPDITFDPNTISYFHDTASNEGVVDHAVFLNYSVNNGSIMGNASFNNFSENAGFVYGDAYVDSTATVPQSSVAGTILPAGLAFDGYTTCNPSNGERITLYIKHDELLAIGTKLYSDPFFYTIFSGEFFMSSVRYEANTIDGITSIGSCDPYAV